MLTACEITTTQQAQDCLRWYCLDSHCLGWRIEDWQRVLKSACRIDALQHKTAERLQRAIASHLVLGWRIMQMTLLGLASPDLPAERLFSNLEIEVRQAYAKQDESTKRIDKPTRLGDAVGIADRLGGTIGRAKDARPPRTRSSGRSIRTCSFLAEACLCAMGHRTQQDDLGRRQR